MRAAVSNIAQARLGSMNVAEVEGARCSRKLTSIAKRAVPLADDAIKLLRLLLFEAQVLVLRSATVSVLFLLMKLLTLFDVAGGTHNLI